MRLIDLTLLNPIDFYISRILTMWKLGPLLQCLGAPYIYSIQSHVHDQKKIFLASNHSRKLPPNQKFAKSVIQVFSQKGCKQEKQNKQSIVSL